MQCEAKTNWRKVGLGLVLQPEFQRLVLVLALGASAGSGLSSCDCDAIEQEAAQRLWHLVKAAGAVGLPADFVPSATSGEVFEILDAVAAGVSVPDVAEIVGRSAADIWAILASTF